jgi:ribosomal protein S18 acetylase RimI-like enzyme
VTLPEPLLSFWKAHLELQATPRDTPWGMIVTDPRYPRVYEANHASILRPSPSLTLDEIRLDLLPALDKAEASHEHIEVMDADDDSPALLELLTSPLEQNTDVVMVFEGWEPPAQDQPSGERDSEIRVAQLEEPDEGFWSLYRLVPNEYGEVLADEVLGQMLARAQTVFLPYLRLFTGTVGGETAGMASVLTLEGVAYIDNVMTLGPFRRRGIATAVVTRSVAASLDAGAEMVFLLAEENGAPQRLYEHLGFRVWRRCFGFTRPLHETGRAE